MQAWRTSSEPLAQACRGKDDDGATANSHVPAVGACRDCPRRFNRRRPCNRSDEVESECFKKLHEVFTDVMAWRLVPRHQQTFGIRFMRRPHWCFLVRSFLLIADPVEAGEMLAEPTCVQDQSTKAFCAKYPSPSMAALDLLAEVSTVDISGVECRHATSWPIQWRLTR